MCITSLVIGDWYHPTWPDPPKKADDWRPNPNSITWTQIQQDPLLAVQMLQIIQKLEALDKKLGTLEKCVTSEPEKQKLKRRLKSISRRKKT